MNRLLVHASDPETFCDLLRECDLPELEIVCAADADAARGAISSCNILLGEPALVVDMLDRAENLQWVQSTFAGVERFCTPGLRRDYILTGVKGVHGPLMSEYVFAYILAIERHLFETKQHQAAGAWVETPYRSLRGLTCGICGLGSIGRHLAQTAGYFGMRVLGYKRTPAESPFVERVYTGASLPEFLGLLDYLILVLPDTPETSGLIDSQALGWMKPSAVIINGGRHNAVSEPDLISALNRRLIRAAVLDVFKQEPLPADNPLWSLPNVFITPHNAAFSFPADIVGIFRENYLRFIEKKSLQYVIDFERGY